MGSLLAFIIITGGIILGFHLHNAREKRIQDDIDEIVFVERRWDQKRNDTGQDIQNGNGIIGDCNDTLAELDDMQEVEEIIDT